MVSKSPIPVVAAGWQTLATAGEPPYCPVRKGPKGPHFDRSIWGFPSFGGRSPAGNSPWDRHHRSQIGRPTLKTTHGRILVKAPAGSWSGSQQASCGPRTSKLTITTRGPGKQSTPAQRTPTEASLHHARSTQASTTQVKPHVLYGLRHYP